MLRWRALRRVQAALLSEESSVRDSRMEEMWLLGKQCFGFGTETSS